LLAEVLHVRVGLELREVGKGHALFELRYHYFAAPTISSNLSQLPYNWAISNRLRSRTWRK
jgi:hypothetical protein